MYIFKCNSIMPSFYAIILGTLETNNNYLCMTNSFNVIAQKI